MNMEDTFTIVVRSDATYDGSLSNHNRSSFRNPFISLIGTAHYKIALQSIFITSKFKDASPMLIKIRVEEIAPCLTGEGYHRDIAIISDKKLSAVPFHPFHYSPKKKEYFDFLHPSISHLSVDILDVNNRHVQFEDGLEPIVITFKVQRMKMTSNILRLSSKQSSKYFPENSLSSFRILLSDPLKTEKSLEVALSSIYLPGQIDYNKLISSNGGLHITIGEERYDFTGDCNTLTTSSFIEPWWATLASSVHAKELGLAAAGPDRNAYVLTNRSQKEDAFLSMSYMCAYLFNMELTGTEMGEDAVFKVKKSGGKIRFANLKVEKCVPSIMMLHCNFVSSTFVGTRTHKLLKVFPYNRKEGNEDQIVKMESAQYDFLPVILNENNLLHFEIRDTFDKVVPFKNSDKAEVLLNLIIREKIKDRLF